jgi:hypothetical protein
VLVKGHTGRQNARRVIWHGGYCEAPPSSAFAATAFDTTQTGELADQVEFIGVIAYACTAAFQNSNYGRVRFADFVVRDCAKLLAQGSITTTAAATRLTELDGGIVVNTLTQFNLTNRGRTRCKGVPGGETCAS